MNTVHNSSLINQHLNDVAISYRNKAFVFIDFNFLSNQNICMYVYIYVWTTKCLEKKH